MRFDWVPVSAALWLTGTMGIALGAFLLPRADGASQTLRVVQDKDSQWMAVAVILFLAAVCLTLGLPSVLTLFDRRARVLGMTSGIVLEFGFLGTAGYAMLMVFFRALVNNSAIRGRAFDHVAGDPGLALFLYAWLLGFYAGELLLAIALLRSRAVARWMPVLLITHVATLPIAALLPTGVSKATILLFATGSAGIAIQAASPDPRRL